MVNAIASAHALDAASVPVYVKYAISTQQLDRVEATGSYCRLINDETLCVYGYVQPNRVIT